MPFNNIAAILGKRICRREKRLQSAADYNRYHTKSATAAYSALAGITILGPVLGSLGSRCSGSRQDLANVKKITSTSAPKAKKEDESSKMG